METFLTSCIPTRQYKPHDFHSSSVVRDGDHVETFTEEQIRCVLNEPVHAKRYKLVKIFKICFFAENVRKLS